VKRNNGGREEMGKKIGKKNIKKEGNKGKNITEKREGKN
jgi:hypothetical protein